jgi:hypothetical protein
MVHTQRLASELTDRPTSSYGRRKGVTEPACAKAIAGESGTPPSAAQRARSSAAFDLLGSRGFHRSSVVDLADTAANITTFGNRIIRLADLTTDPPSVLGLRNGYSVFAQYFEDRW